MQFYYMNAVMEEIGNQNFKTYHFKAYFKIFKIHFDKFQSDLFKRSYTIFYLKNTLFIEL